jgi:hypothetical protein
MVQPYNYAIQAPSAFESLVSGLKIGTSLQEMQAQQQQRMLQAQKLQQDMEMKQKQQEQLQLLRAKPFNEWTSEDVTSASMFMPKEGLTFLQQQMSSMSADQRRARALTLGQLGSVALMGDKERTAAAYDQMIEAETNPREKAALQAQRQIALSNPEELVKMYVSILPAIGEEGKTVAENLLKTRQLTPEAKAEAQRKAAEARIKEAEANLAPQKFAADLGLTESQIEQAKASVRASDAAAKKSGAEAAKAQREAEMMSAGVIPADKRPEAEGKMRQEYSNQTKSYQDVKAAYGRVLASREDAAGDLALIFNYMKMLDPGSVVREGEFATAQNAAGIPTRIWNLYNKLINGERLSAEQRKMFSKQSESLYQQALKDENKVRSGIERIARGYGLNVANIFYTPTEEPPTAPAAEVSGATVQPPATARPAATTEPVRGGREIGGGFRVLD